MKLHFVAEQTDTNVCSFQSHMISHPNTNGTQGKTFLTFAKSVVEMKMKLSNSMLTLVHSVSIEVAGSG